MTESKKSLSELYPWSMLPPTASELQHQVEAVGLRHAFQVATQPFTPCTPLTYTHPLAQAMVALEHYKTDPPIERLGAADKTTTEIPAALFWEYGLDTVQPYVQLTASSMDLMQDSIQWQRLKGTPESVRLGMKWLNLNEIDFVWGEDEHFHEYQIELKGLDSGDDHAAASAAWQSPLRQKGIHYHQSLQNIAEILKLSSPVRAQCTRVFRRPGREADRQPMDLSASNSHFGQILSDFDGILHQKSGLRVSFHDVREARVHYRVEANADPEQRVLKQQAVSAPKCIQRRTLTYQRDWSDEIQVPRLKQHRHFAQARRLSSQRQWYGRWNTLNWNTAHNLLGFRQSKWVTHVLNAHIQPQHLDTAIGDDVQCITWKLQVDGAKQHRHFAQRQQLSSQRQWYGRWNTLEWNTPHNLLGFRQSKWVTHVLNANIQPQHVDTAIGSDVQHLTWAVRVANVKYSHISQPCNLPSQKQWYGRWDNTDWHQARLLYGSRRERGVAVDAQVALSITSYQRTLGVDVNLIRWEPGIQRSRSMTIGETIVRTKQRQWYGSWQGERWDSACDILGFRQSKRLTHVVAAHIQPQQVDTALGADVQHLTWAVRVANVKYSHISQPCNLPSQKQWYGRWDNTDWHQARLLYGSRRERGVAVDAQVALSITSYQRTLGVDANVVHWEPAIQRSRSMTIGETMVRAKQRQWYGSWQGERWDSACDILGFRQSKRLTHMVAAHIQPQQVDTALGADVQHLTWAVRVANVKYSHISQPCNLPSQKQWYGLWDTTDWHQARVQYGSRRQRGVAVAAQVTSSLISHQGMHGVAVQVIQWAPVVHSARMMRIGRTMVRSSQCQWFGCWEADACWDTARDVLGYRQSTRVTHLIDAQIQPRQVDTALGADVQRLNWSVRAVNARHPHAVQAFDVSAQTQWYDSWNELGWDEARSTPGSRHKRKRVVVTQIAWQGTSHVSRHRLHVRRMHAQPTLRSTRLMAVAHTLDRVHSTQNDTTKSVVVGGRQLRWFESAVDTWLYPLQPNAIARARASRLTWLIGAGAWHDRQPHESVEPISSD